MIWARRSSFDLITGKKKSTKQKHTKTHFSFYQLFTKANEHDIATDSASDIHL